jgi:hypothetical protein
VVELRGPAVRRSQRLLEMAGGFDADTVSLGDAWDDVFGHG